VKTVTFNNTNLTLVEDSQYEFLLSNKNVALGYGTTIKNLAHTKRNNKDELTEGKHFIKLEVQTKGGKQSVIHWTKKGIVRLGFFIKSAQAKAFRDWAEDYIVDPHSNNAEIEELKKIILKQNHLIANSKPKNKFTGFYENKDRSYFGKRENEWLYTRYEWMILLNECERQLREERNKSKPRLFLK
jgi:hypothetical protein